MIYGDEKRKVGNESKGIGAIIHIQNTHNNDNNENEQYTNFNYVCLVKTNYW